MIIRSTIVVAIGKKAETVEPPAFFAKESCTHEQTVKASLKDAIKAAIEAIVAEIPRTASQITQMARIVIEAISTQFAFVSSDRKEARMLVIIFYGLKVIFQSRLVSLNHASNSAVGI